MPELPDPSMTPDEPAAPPTVAAPPITEADLMIERDAEKDSLLYRSTKLRFPRWDSERTPQEKRGLIEQHIWETATMRAELAELRLRAWEALKNARRDWAKMRGWEAHRGGDRTEASVERAKRRANPALYDRMEDARFVVDRCTEEMTRLDRDYDAASRAYSVLVGS